MPRILPFRGALLGRRVAVLPEITITTPISPQPVGAPIVVSGTYRGSPTGITLTWRQDGLDVSAPVAVTSFAEGTWSGTVTTPAGAGSYRLRVAFNDTNPTADSEPIEIVAGASTAPLASFVFEGTGTTTDSIALFGHGFAQGEAQTVDQFLLRRTDNDGELRTQVNVLSTWPDGSVRSALLAGEMPALADTTTLEAALWVGEAHPDPGSALSFASALSGRSAQIAVFNPPDGSTPDWTFDPLDGIGSPDWHVGPLAISARREIAVPQAVVGVSSVRLIVDVIVTKDGILRLDVCFSNDRVHHSGGGTATLGYTIAIDGETLYSQKPASGAATVLKQYGQWIRRCGRNAAGTVKLGRGQTHDEAVYFRPDQDALVRAKLTFGYDTTQAWSGTLNAAASDIGDSAKETDPWWPWGLARSAGAVGGRPEIGYRTQAVTEWMAFGTRAAQRLAQRQFEAAATRPMYMAGWAADHGDIGVTRWLNPVDWPKFRNYFTETSSVGTARANVQGLPSGQGITHNETDNITIDDAHHGNFNWGPALFSGRRLAYDSLAARSNWSVMLGPRANGALGSSPPWRDLTPDHATGRAWARQPWVPQTRGIGWDLRDHVDCAAILPDSYDARIMYDRHVEAVFNALKDVLATIEGQQGTALGLPILHAQTPRMPGYMFAYYMYGALAARQLGIGGPNMPEITEKLVKCYLGNFLDGGYPWRRAHTGTPEMHFRTSFISQSWADVWAQTEAAGGVDVPADWNVSGFTLDTGSYQRTTINLCALMLDTDLPLEQRADAADALVLLRSERQGSGGDPHPRTFPGRFFNPEGMYQVDLLNHPDFSWRWDSAPTIPAGQSFTIEGDAPAGSVVGLVRFIGPIPRNSAGNGFALHDAFVIAAQPAGNPFTISRGGAVRLVGNPPAAGTVQIEVYCRTWEGNGSTEHRSATVEANINITAKPAAILSVVPTSPQQVLEGASIGTVIYTVQVGGNAPITPSISSGNTTLFEFVHDAGTSYVLRTKAALTGELNTYPLTLRVENGHGSDNANVSIEVVANAHAPVIGSGQTFDLPESNSTGGATDPQNVAYTGGVPTTAEFTAGNTGSRLAVGLTGSDVRITMAVATKRLDVAQITPTLRLANVGGEDAKQITVNIIQPWVLRSAAPSAHYWAVWSCARRLVDTYTGPLIRVRRASDNAEQDIGFTASGGHQVLDEDALTAFIGSSTWYVVTAYDQSLSGFDVSQATAGSQPIGGTSGGINRLGSGNRVAMNMDSQKALIRASTTIPYTPNRLAVLWTARTGSTVSGTQYPFRTAAASIQALFGLSGGALYLQVGNGSVTHGTAYGTATNIVGLARFQADGGSNRLRVQGTDRSVAAANSGNQTPSTTGQQLQLGDTWSGGQWRGLLSEAVLMLDMDIADEAEVMSNASAFYGV